MERRELIVGIGMLIGFLGVIGTIVGRLLVESAVIQTPSLFWFALLVIFQGMWVVGALKWKEFDMERRLNAVKDTREWAEPRESRVVQVDGDGAAQSTAGTGQATAEDWRRYGSDKPTRRPKRTASRNG